MIDWNYKNENQIFSICEREGVPYLSFKALEATGLVKNGFSTRLGGASKGKFATMNFSYSRGDEPQDVLENFTRMARALEVDRDRMVVSYQTHTVNVRRVTKEDEGKGVIRERDYRDVDGLITNVPGITLVTFYADCVPLYLVDTVHRAIGLSHSGWRGTVNRMGQITLDAMGEAFGTDPKDVVACIGPSICRDCFEVGAEVAEAFGSAFAPKWHSLLFSPNGKPGKYQLDLWKANEIIFLEAGVRPENIHTTNICTMCNSGYLFSHRRVGEERGNLGAFLCLK
ncbi:peptidoglycan editing factor PgeF [Lacrimispora sp. 210928-DFI.3.58]|uniref:peptidoglycan editing factor PgeF n=1 Tax=Lacrimispora sp. 210928-DFI.3.58 TaxID=2883214 RepID=UPI0015B40083|nr:peptidoglycan editing factor PgeF [Lacrimispora sp. 210928-DFI.3.58]MCB7317847.1 peptidoglycan editing factor PgeF [Lacrimispora sp. 210928-DFI.3.58]